MGTVTSTLDIVLKDDVSKNAAQIDAAMKKIVAEAKAVDSVLASSGAGDKFAAGLKRVGAGVVHIEAATKAMRDYAAAEGLAASRGEWTKKQVDGFRAMEGVVVSGVRATIGAQKAQDAAAVQSFEKSVGLWRQETAARQRENERQLADDRRTAEQRAEIHQREIAREQRDRVREYEQEQRLHHRMMEQREHGVAHHGIVNYALQSAAIAVSAHEMVHVGAEAWHQGAELQHERLGLRNAGRSAAEAKEIEEAARGVIGNTPTAGMVESMKTVAETTAAFGSVHHAIENLPFMMKAVSVLKTAGGENIQGDAASVGQDFAKTFEQRQTRPEDFEKEAKAMIPAMVATGGTFNPRELYMFAQQAKSALPSLSMRFLGGIAPSLIGAQGGERAGTGLKAFEDVIAGKAHDTKQAEAWMKLGLLDPSKTITKAGHATSWSSGAVKDTFLAMTDPLAWSEKYLIPALQKQGVDTNSREATQMILNTMFRNQNANMMATELAQEASRARLHKDEALYGQVGSFDEIYKRNLQDFGVASEALKTALGNLAGAVTSPLMHATSNGLNVLTKGINGLAEVAFEHPNIAAGGGVIAGAAALTGAGYMSYQLMNGFGLGTSAKALDAAAAHLMEVGGPGGFGRTAAGAGAAGAIEAGAPALAIPGAVQVGAAAIAGGIAVATVGLVKAAAESQEPGKGGQWSMPTYGTRPSDEARLADQKAELADVEHQLAVNKARAKLPDAFDPNSVHLNDRAGELRVQIQTLENGLKTLDRLPREDDRETRSRPWIRNPGDVPVPVPRSRWSSDKDGEQFGPPVPPWDERHPDGINRGPGVRIIDANGDSPPPGDPYGREALRGNAMMKAFGPSPQVDTSGIDAVKAKADEAHAALDGLNMGIAPSVSLASIDALIAKIAEARQALASLGGAGAAARPGPSVASRARAQHTNAGSSFG